MKRRSLNSHMETILSATFRHQQCRPLINTTLLRQQGILTELRINNTTLKDRKSEPKILKSGVPTPETPRGQSTGCPKANASASTPCARNGKTHHRIQSKAASRGHVENDHVQSLLGFVITKSNIVTNKYLTSTQECFPTLQSGLYRFIGFWLTAEAPRGLGI